MSALKNDEVVKSKMANNLKTELENIASRNNLVTLNEVFDLDNIVNQVTFGLVEVNYAAITFGTPHQGVGLSAVSVVPRSGFINVAPKLNYFKGEIQAGLSEDVSILSGFRYLFGDLFTFLYASPYLAAGGAYCGFDPAWCRGHIQGPIKGAQKVGVDYLDGAFFAAESIIGNKLESISGQNTTDPTEALFDYGLKELLKPDLGDGDQGEIIDQINALPDPEFYRNVFGAEKYPVPARVSSELVVINFNIPFTGLDFDDEQEFSESFGNTKTFAGLQKDTWWTQHQVTYVLCQGLVLKWKKRCNAKKDRHKRRSRNWGRTERALGGIDATWGTLINANKYEQRTDYRQIYDPSICETGDGSRIPGFYKYAKVENIELLINAGELNCDPYRYESYNYVTTIPLKNDGVTTPNHSTWNKNDNVYSESSNNFYYDDSGDGGYNHLEIRRAKRLYTQGANKKGDLAEPMRETREWLENTVLRNN